MIEEGLIEKTLIIAGTGIQSISHLTEEVKLAIKECELTLFLINEPLLKDFISNNARHSFDLESIYFKYEKRIDAYSAIATHIVNTLDNNKKVCALSYGHPFFCASPFLQAAKKASSQGYNVLGLPGISSLACLFSDLMLDPVSNGLQVYEATQLLKLKPNINALANLVLLQVGFINLENHTHTSQTNEIDLLYSYLLNFYPEEHLIYLYKASLYPGSKPEINTIRLSELSAQQPTSLSSIYIPPIT